MNETTNTNTIDIEITIRGTTRTVTFTYMNGSTKAHSAPVFGCRVGHGAKVHRTTGTAWLKDGAWVFNECSGYALNGQRPIVAWADEIAESVKSKHIGTHIR